AEEAEFAHLGHDGFGDFVGLGHLVLGRHEALAHEAADAVEQGVQGFWVADHRSGSWFCFAGTGLSARASTSCAWRITGRSTMRPSSCTAAPPAASAAATTRRAHAICCASGA